MRKDIWKSMKPHGDPYEVIILGSGLGGLIAGTLLSSQNRSVYLLKEKKYHPSSLIEGYRFVPFSNFSERCLKSTFLKNISRMLNLSLMTGDRKENGRDEIKLGRPKKQTLFQVILPKARIDIFCRRSLLQREWQREFPGEAAQIENFYGEIDRVYSRFKKRQAQGNPWSVFPIQPRSLFKHWFSWDPLPNGRLSEKLSPFSREFREFIQLQLISWGNLYPDRFPSALADFLLFNDEAEDWVLGLDLEKLKEKLFEKFVQAGGRMGEVEGAEEVDVKKGKGFTLLVKGDRKIFRSKYLIFNSPLHRLSNLLRKKEKLLLRWREKIEPRFILIPLFLGMDEKGVPVGMGDLLVSRFDLKRPEEEGNLLFLAFSRKGDEEEAPDGKRALTVESLVPMGKWNPHSFAEHQEGVMQHLTALFPFLEKHIEFTDWSWANEQTQCWSYPHFLYETSFDFHWKAGVIPNRLSQNVYFIGKENFPYLGLEGEVLSGWMVAQKILQR